MKPASAAGRPARVPQPQAPARGGRRNLWLILGSVAAAAIVAAVLIVANRGGSGSPSQPAGLAGAAETAALLRGIPQQGTALGSPNAPVTLVEYADLQCPICAKWATQALPTIVRRYVRTGKVRIEFRGLRFLGPDSNTALRTALAAGASGKLWNVVDLLYRNQGAENSGWVSESLLRSVVAAAGLDAGTVLATRSSTAVEQEIAASEREAALEGVPGTPAFDLGPTGGALDRIELTTFDPSELGAAIEALLAR